MTSGPAANRTRLLMITGGLVGLALLGTVLVLVLGGDDDEKEGRPAPPAIRPLELTAAADTSGVIGIDGAPTSLPPADQDAILATITGYLKDATITPLSTPPPDEDADEADGTTTSSAPATAAMTAHFTDSAAASLDAERLLAVADAHLPFASDGVSTTKATVALAGIVRDGATEFVNATIDVGMVVRTDDPITVNRAGDLLLRRVDGTWRIAAYNIAVERSSGDGTTTSEAAFG